MPDGYHLRSLPDGCLEFVLAEPSLRSLVVADHVTLRFGPVEVTLSAPFDLIVGGVVHVLDPAVPPTLVPLVALVHGVVRWLVAVGDGGLSIAFVKGQRLVVPGPVSARSWRVDGPSGGR